jgi:deazaflavin-dependent oxidoreductase (nitroreductase family)
MGSTLKTLTRVFNPLAMPIAALGVIPVWGVVRHTGRKSGRTFTTPVALGATRDYFYVPLPYGDRTDWCRNVIAAGGGEIRYGGRYTRVREPEFVSAEEAKPAFPRVIRPLIDAFGMTKFIRLRRSDTAQRAA